MDLVRDHVHWDSACEDNSTCYNTTVTLFTDAMTAVLNASEAILGRIPVIGYIVLPRNTSYFKILFDMVLHRHFPCYQYARTGDYIEYDIVQHTKAAQYAYQIPWERLHEHSVAERINHPDSDDTENEEDSFFLLANLEPDFFELTGGCVLDVCGTGDLRSRAWPALGEDALWSAARKDSTSSNRASSSWHFEQAVRALAGAVAAYMNHTGTDGHGKFRGVAVTGAASEQAMTALRLALYEALPYANDTQFYDTIDPASVFSLGAAVLGRNMQLADEQMDCDCRVSEDLRRQHSYPSDDEFPCNRRMAHLDSYCCFS